MSCPHPHTPAHGYTGAEWTCLSCVARMPAVVGKQEQVVTAVANAYAIPPSWICATSRATLIIPARAVLCAVLVRVCGMNASTVGRLLWLPKSSVGHFLARVQSEVDLADVAEQIIQQLATTDPATVAAALPVSSTQRPYLVAYLRDVLLANRPRMTQDAYHGLRIVANNAPLRTQLARALVREGDFDLNRAYWRDSTAGVESRVQLQSDLYLGRAA